jgi:pimeloyl-ACP methyl ester carboxylesterase
MTTPETKRLDLGDAELAYQIRGDGPPLLLLHGFLGSSADWVHLFDLDQLARGHRLIMPDTRGHGQSTNPGGTFSHRQCAQDVRALLDHLNIDRVKAVGLSSGGNTLLHLATSAPGRVDAMVLIGAPSYYPAPARAIMRAVPDEGPTEQIRALARIARGFAASHDDMAFTPPLLATIAARTLIVTGDRDPLYPLEIFVEQYRAIPGAALMVIPNGGHDAVFGEARPDFVRTALAFLRG